MALVLGAAFGARATAAEVRDADSGVLVAAGVAPHEPRGAAPDDPTVWWRALATAVAATGERDIAAISLAGSHPGLVLLDGAGAVLRPMQPWDAAAASGDAARLRKAFGQDGWARRTGAVPGPGAAVSRLAWLARTDPELFSRIGSALLPHDWLTYRLSGRAVTDRGSASLSGAWSPRADDWSTEVLELLGSRGAASQWRSRLPEVLGPSDQADWLTAPVFELLGLRGRPLVAPGTGEPMAVALALGVGRGGMGVSLGSSTTVIVGCGRPVADATGEVRSRADAAGGHLAMVTAGGGAALVNTIGELLELDADGLGALADATPPSPDAPILVPSIPGRTGGVLTRLLAGCTRGQLALAAFEGTACTALDALDRCVAVGAALGDEEPLRLCAPDASVGVHAQLLADLSGLPVLAAPPGVLAAAGACIQAAAVLRGDDPAEVSAEWALTGDTWVEPADGTARTERRQRHADERARQRSALSEED